MKHTPTRYLSILMAILAGLLLCNAHGFESRTAEEVRVATDEVVENHLYAAGNTVIIDGTVAGDLVVAARRVTINGTVEGDLIAAAQTIIIDGQIGEAARLAAQTMELREGASIADHLVAAGDRLEMAQGSSVMSTLAFTGRRALIEGEIGGDARLTLPALQLAGRIGGDLDLRLGQVPAWQAPRFFMGIAEAPDAMRVNGELIVTEDARIEGDARIVSLEVPEIPPGVLDGELEHIAPEIVEPSPLLEQLRRYAALALLGLLGLLLVPGLVKGAGRRLERKPWQGLSWGALTLIAVPLAAALIVGIAGLLAFALYLLALGGLGVAVIAAAVVFSIVLLLLYVLALVYLVQIVVGYAAGRWLLEKISPNLAQSPYLALLFGLLLVVLLTAIPVAGDVISLVIVLFGLGGLMQLGWRERQVRRA